MVDSTMNARDTARNMTREIAVLHAVACLGKLPKVMVETGTTRGPDGFGTRCLAGMAKKSGGHAWTVDLDPKAIAFSRRIVPAYIAECVDFVEGDSVRFFCDWTGAKIDLLYLDSAYDPAVTLAEAESAMPHLAEECAVVIDDCERGPVGAQGKGTLAIPYLQGFGFKVKYFSGGKKTVATLWRTKG